MDDFRTLSVAHVGSFMHRWLRSPNALLYDPALRRTLHNLMKKLFMQLVAEFKRLGSTIVYANFNKIIICTKKRNVNDAVAYVEFVVSSIRNKELFHSLQMSYSQCWEYLLWLDPANHGGVKGKLPGGLGDVGEERKDHTVSLNMDETDAELNLNDDVEGPEVVMNWSLSEYLPEKSNVQGYFFSILGGYISAVYQFIFDKDCEFQTPRRMNKASLSQTQSMPTGVGTDEETLKYAKELIQGDLSQKLFMITQKIQKKLPTYTATDGDVVIAEGLTKKDMIPALEFVKSICKVLSLDSTVEEEVSRLRRNLLRIVGVGEFSEMSQWTDPCATIVLPEVICRACNHCRDIDLCKDTNRTEENNVHMWLCPICGTNYDNMEIEGLLLDILNRKSMGYTLQDIQCARCLQIKMENMTEHCTCAGEFHTMVKREELGTYLRTFKAIAQHFNMNILLHTVEWLIQLNPTI